MNQSFRARRWALLPQRLRGVFNLNDPRWGRGDDKPVDEERPDTNEPPSTPTTDRPRLSKPGGQPPDLDELWRDLNRKLSGLFGGKNGGGRGPVNGGVGIGLIAGIAVLIWLSTGFFIVQEGQQAVITQFGKYKTSVGAGFNWRLPYPIQRHELVFVTQIRSVDVGRDTVIKSTGLRESAMLTTDENIVEIKFAVQYRLNDARAWLFESKNPGDAVVQAAETAVREVVGKMRMDSALAEERDQIAPRVRALMQTILDRYVGAQRQQIVAAFENWWDKYRVTLVAYANDVIPRAVGSASRLKEEADAYKARIVAQAQGDSQRFSAVLTEYQKAPQVTRDRMYLESMQQIYSSVTKVLVDSRQGSNLLYLPLDKIMQTVAQQPASGLPESAVASGAPAAAASTFPTDARARDTSRTRERESR